MKESKRKKPKQQAVHEYLEFEMTLKQVVQSQLTAKDIGLAYGSVIEQKIKAGNGVRVIIEVID
jgi:hypothetical protein